MATAKVLAAVGTDGSVKLFPLNDRKEAEKYVSARVSDLVYEALGGDEEFLYDDDGELLPDEQIVDDVEEILELGREEYLCFVSKATGLWAYSESEDSYGLEFAITETELPEELEEKSSERSRR